MNNEKKYPIGLIFILVGLGLLSIQIYGAYLYSYFEVPLGVGYNPSAFHYLRTGPVLVSILIDGIIVIIGLYLEKH